MKEEWRNPKGITPQKFETNDGSWSIEVCDEGLFTLKTCDDEEWVFNDEELEIIIKLLEAARQINPYQIETIIKEKKKVFTCRHF